MKPRRIKSGQMRHDVRLPSYDVIGNIAIVRFGNLSRAEIIRVAEALIQRSKNVKTVLGQVGAVSGDLRLRRLRWIKGEKNYMTVYREHGCVFKVDLKDCYFSPRLSHERKRIASQGKPGEMIVNMFAGAGLFSILMAKLGSARQVFSIDINPTAVKLMQENARLNRVENRIVPIQGDAKDIILEHLQRIADRVVMPLPMKAYAYLDYAVMALKPSGGWIHYYDFEHASRDENPIAKARAKVENKLRRLGVEFEVSSGRVVRSIGPRWYQIALDVQIG